MQHLSMSMSRGNGQLQRAILMRLAPGRMTTGELAAALLPQPTHAAKQSLRRALRSLERKGQIGRTIGGRCYAKDDRYWQGTVSTQWGLPAEVERIKQRYRNQFGRSP